MDNERRIDSVIQHIELNYKIVEGYVVDDKGCKISCACVKVLDIYSNPIVHAFTDYNGYFKIVLLTEKSCFRIFATKDEYKTSDIQSIFLSTAQIIKINIKLERLNNSFAYGVGYVLYNYKPVDFCEVELYRLNCGITTLIERIITDKKGMFILDSIPDGMYIVVAENNLFSFKGRFLISKGLNKLILNVRLKPNMINGTISGVITDNEGNRVPDALVILQRKDGKLIKFTRTNSQGEYLFYNVEKGEYSIITSAKK